MYIPGGPKAGARTEVGAQEAASIGVKVLLPLIGALSESLSLPAGVRL